MQISLRWSLAALIALALPLAGCHKAHKSHEHEHPAHVEHIDGSDIAKVTLTEKAIERIDLQTATVGQEAGRIVVPYSSLIYDPHCLT